MGMNDDYKLDAEMSRRRINRLKTDYELMKYCYMSAAMLFKDI